MALRRFPQHASLLGLLTILSVTCLQGSAFAANQAGSPSAAARIVDTIDETRLVSLRGQTHPLAVARFDQGPVSDTLPLDHMFLELRRSSEQEERLESALREIQDPHSARYHSWLTADELGRRFGPAQQDIETVVRWLEQQGLQVNRVSKNGLTIDVSGTAGQVRQVFHAEIHNYLVNGKQHIANAGDPQIPAALAPVVVGFVALHDFMPKPALRKPTANFSFPCDGCPAGYQRHSVLRRSPCRPGHHLQRYPVVHSEHSDHRQRTNRRRARGYGRKPSGCEHFPHSIWPVFL